MGKRSLLQNVSCTFYNPLEPRFRIPPKIFVLPFSIVSHKALTKHEEIHAQTNKNTKLRNVSNTPKSNMQQITGLISTVRGFGLEIFLIRLETTKSKLCSKLLSANPTIKHAKCIVCKLWISLFGVYTLKNTYIMINLLRWFFKLHALFSLSQ